MVHARSNLDMHSPSAQAAPLQFAPDSNDLGMCSPVIRLHMPNSFLAWSELLEAEGLLPPVLEQPSQQGAEDRQWAMDWGSSTPLCKISHHYREQSAQEDEIIKHKLSLILSIHLKFSLILPPH